MKTKRILAMLALLALCVVPVYADDDDDYDYDDDDVAFSVGVGDYDYLPYSSSHPRSLNFRAVLGDYGQWVSVHPFGNVWRPHVSSGWRPYTHGHWTTTQYGQTWVGYEPWSWAANHYGNWVFTQRYGWVWIPGYEYHPGRVAWSNSYNAIGWTPAPPYGYDYSRGYLSYRGPRNQFTYYDDDFAISLGFGGDDNYYGGPYYSPYRDHFYNSAYLNMVPNLWVFVDRDRYFHDNYADVYLGPRFVRNAFDRRLIRLSARPLRRDVLERIVKRKVKVVSVRERIIELDRRRARIVVPAGEERRIRKFGPRVVREVVAPAFAEKRVAFKNKSRFKNMSREELIRDGRKLQQQRENARTRIVRDRDEQILKVKAREKDVRKSDKAKQADLRSDRDKRDFRNERTEKRDFNNERKERAEKRELKNERDRKPSSDRVAKSRERLERDRSKNVKVTQRDRRSSDRNDRAVKRSVSQPRERFDRRDTKRESKVEPAMAKRSSRSVERAMVKRTSRPNDRTERVVQRSTKEQQRTVRNDDRNRQQKVEPRKVERKVERKEKAKKTSKVKRQKPDRDRKH